MITYEDIRTLRDKASGNLTALCFKVSQWVWWFVVLGRKSILSLNDETVGCKK